MEDVLYFMREKRASLLIGGGSTLAFVWFVFMLYFRLFEISPFGAESGWGMGVTLLITVPLAPALLWFIYWVGSGESPLGKYNFAYEACRFVYVAFKNFIVLLVVVTFIIGGPRMKYYQMRVEKSTGFDNLSYYEQRTLFNLFRDGSSIIDATSDYSEEPSIGIAPLAPSVDLDTDSDSKSSSKKSGDLDGIAELLCMLGAIILLIAAVLYFFVLVFMATIYTNFWLVTTICLAVGMVTLGIIDIRDGPRI